MIPVLLLKAAPYIALVVGLGVSHSWMYVKGVKNTENKHLVAVAQAKDDARKIEDELRSTVDMQALEIEVERTRRAEAEKKQQEKVKVYVTKIDPRCPSIDGEFRVLHNDALPSAPSPDPAPAPVRNDPPGRPNPPAEPEETELARVTPGEVIETVTENYKKAGVWRLQLVACQQYINTIVRPFFAPSGE